MSTLPKLLGVHLHNAVVLYTFDHTIKVHQMKNTALQLSGTCSMLTITVLLIQKRLVLLICFLMLTIA